MTRLLPTTQPARERDPPAVILRPQRAAQAAINQCRAMVEPQTLQTRAATKRRTTVTAPNQSLTTIHAVITRQPRTGVSRIANPVPVGVAHSAYTMHLVSFDDSEVMYPHTGGFLTFATCAPGRCVHSRAERRPGMRAGPQLPRSRGLTVAGGEQVMGVGLLGRGCVSAIGAGSERMVQEMELSTGKAHRMSVQPWHHFCPTMGSVDCSTTCDAPHSPAGRGTLLPITTPWASMR